MLKKLIPYIFLLFVCAGCVHSVEERLVRVSELADCGEVDSAMVMLENISIDNLNEHNRRYYDLMSIKVRDKAYEDIKGDTIITELIRYFEDEGSLSERAEAYYYGGRVYREMGDLPQSLDYFQQALDALAGDDSRIRLKGKICSQMGQMFFDLNMYEQAIPKFHIAVDFNKMFCDSINLVYNYRAISDIYYKTNDADSTLKYLEKALNIAKDIKDSYKCEIEIRNSIVDCYIKLGLYNHAREEYFKLDSIKSLCNDCTEDYLKCTAINMSIVNREYNKTEQLAKQLTLSSSAHSRWFAYGILKDIVKQKKNNSELYEYLDKYEKCIDYINAQTSRESVIHQNSFYNYSLRERENLNLREYKNRTKYIYVLSLLSLIIIILGVAYFVTYRRKAKLAIHLKEEKIKKIESELQKIENLQTSEKIESITIGNNIRAEYLKLIEIKTPYKISLPEELLASSIYNKLKTSAKNDNIRIETEEWIELEKLVLTFYPKFKTTLVMLHSSISDYEYHVCLLTKCQFNNKEISKLTYHSPSGVTSTRSRLFEKIFSVKGSASDMDYLINLL